MRNRQNIPITENKQASITRRKLIRLAGQSTLFAALSPTLAKAAASVFPDEASHSVSPIMQQLSAYMAAAATRPLPDEVIEKAKQHILDTFAAMQHRLRPD